MKRRITRQLQLGSVFIGGDAPVSVQSMTNTRRCCSDFETN
mgnify:CR=1 FL=1